MFVNPDKVKLVAAMAEIKRLREENARLKKLVALFEAAREEKP